MSVCKKIKIIFLFLSFFVGNFVLGQQPGSGYALNFDGTNDFANAYAADLTAHTDNFTIEFWAQASATRTTQVEANTGVTGTPGNGQRYIVFPQHGGGSNAGAGVSLGTNGISVYEHGGGYMPSLLVYDVTLSGWNHIAVVYTAKQPVLYINGILVRTGLTSLRAAVFPGARLGGHPYGYYSGDLDEYRVWSTSRTQTEIRDNMCKKLVGNETGLERYYRIDDGSGTTVTDVTGTQNGTMSNMAPATDWVTSGASLGNTSSHVYAAAWSGDALDFDGTDDYVDGHAADLNAITDNFTMEMWINSTGTHTIRTEATSGITGTTGQDYACYPQFGGASNAGAGISVGQNGIQVFEHGASYLPCLASYSATLSGWNHIAVVYTAKQPTIYLNGVAVHTGLTSVRAAVFPSGYIGGRIYGFLQGQLDDYRIWNYSRTASQIASNMCTELTGAEAGLVRYYDFNAGVGTTTATDLTGTNNGTLTNMVPASDWVTTGAGACASGTLIHQSHELDSLGVSSVSGFSEGIHIYHVEQVPNSTTGILGLGGNDHYYGVFKAGEVTPTTYTATYYYDENDSWQSSSPILSETGLALFTRSDNAVTTWTNTGVLPNIVANTLTAPAQSTEFILGAVEGVPLPIELISFNANALENNSVRLDWQTATEINNDYFTVERSIDGNTWEYVNEVNGSGNSTTTKNYFSFDLEPYKGTSYYRLKQTDFNGEFQYSKMRIVTLKSSTIVNIFPNPTNSYLTISGSAIELESLKIFNILGQDVTTEVRNIKTEETKVIVDLSLLDAGVYFIKTKSTSSKIGKL